MSRRPLGPAAEAARRRLLSGERGAVIKDPGGRLRVAAVWPGSYRTGMSSLGYGWVHGYLSGRPDALSERFFRPEELGGRAASLETGSALADFDLVAASLVVENDYWMLPAILEAGGLPPLRADRGPRHPLVAAGGVGAWSNPWPVMPFVDLVLLGEGEAAWPRLADLLAGPEFREAAPEERLRLLRDRVPGALVPGLWPEGAGLSDLEPASPAFLAWPPPPGALPPVSPIVAKEAEFSGTALAEISRGCPWGCRFCLAGFLYRPHRPWPKERIVTALERWLAPGAKVGLVSPAVADHPELPEILDELIGRGAACGVSSLRLSSVTEGLARRLAKGGARGLAVAPEAATGRLRGIINKNLSESEILASARLLAEGGLKNLKLYFMIGLPGEADEDLAAMADLAGRIRKAAAGKGKGPKVAVSAANFTPKPHTPFETAPLLTERALREKGRKLAEFMRKMAPGVELRLDPPKWAVVQGLLARGGPESAGLTTALWKASGRPGPALKAYGYTEADPAHGEGDPRKPWRVVAPRAGTEVLAAEMAKSRLGDLTGPCPPALGCGRCQACRDIGG